MIAVVKEPCFYIIASFLLNTIFHELPGNPATQGLVMINAVTDGCDEIAEPDQIEGGFTVVPACRAPLRERSSRKGSIASAGYLQIYGM